MECCKEKMIFKHHHQHNHGGGNAIYFLQNVHGFVAIITGIGKAVFWPAILMFKLLTYLKI